MNVVCNNKPLDLEEGSTVTSLLDRLGLDTPYALVERNGEPVERERYSELELREGDNLVVARPTAGG